MVGMGVISTWIISMVTYIVHRFKLKREVEEREIYLENLRVHNHDITKDKNAIFNQFIIESEMNMYRTAKFIIIVFTIAAFPCKYYSIKPSLALAMCS